MFKEYFTEALRVETPSLSYTLLRVLFHGDTKQLGVAQRGKGALHTALTERESLCEGRSLLE